MVVLKGFLLIFLVQSVFSDGTLRQVNLVYRHGDRSPIMIFPTDPNQVDKWPQGLGWLSTQGLLSLSSNLIVSLLVAEAVCASDNDVMKTRLLSSNLFMSGIATIVMTLLGIRLPLFQGPASEYVVPLLLVSTVDDAFCTSKSRAGHGAPEPTIQNTTLLVNSTGDDISMDRILTNIRSLQGSLMVAGVVHAMFGFTGLIGVLLRYVGPMTIVPALLLIFLFLVNPVLNFVETCWPIAMSTVAVAVILFLYLSKYNMPIPVWTPSGGCRIIRYPLHQVFAILISILINWALCGVLTSLGVFTDNPKLAEYQARTDARSDIIADNPWFLLPYPGQFGKIGFHSASVLTCLIATMLTILDSIGDYYACARVCRAPAPPPHAVNRGILMEGVCSFISGAVGTGNATTTYGGNVGAIGVTKVASRHVFVVTGILYILFGVFGKFSAVFITIPHPVLGGAIIVNFAIFLGVVVSNLSVTNMGSTRNMAIFGLALFIGLLVPTWVQRVKGPIQTGHSGVNNIIKMLLGNPNLCGTIIAFVLDNTVPGTREERGIAAWQMSSDSDSKKLDPELYSEGYDVYQPLLPVSVTRWKVMKYIPFLPYNGSD